MKKLLLHVLAGLGAAVVVFYLFVLIRAYI